MCEPKISNNFDNDEILSSYKIRPLNSIKLLFDNSLLMDDACDGACPQLMLNQSLRPSVGSERKREKSRREVGNGNRGCTSRWRNRPNHIRSL